MTLREDIQKELDKREGKKIAKEVIKRMLEPPKPDYFAAYSGVVVVMSGASIVWGSGGSFGRPGTQHLRMPVIQGKPQL
jgi:hypothetical protein